MTTYADGRDVAETFLTTFEKAELLRVGRWGERTSRMEWGDLSRTIKASHGGKYPADWPEAVVFGFLFLKHGDTLTNGMSIHDDVEKILQESASPSYSYNNLVYVHGLLNCSDLNNRCACVCESKPREHDGRIGIRMLLGKDRYWVKPSNLFLLDSRTTIDTAHELSTLSADERKAATRHLVSE